MVICGSDLLGMLNSWLRNILITCLVKIISKYKGYIVVNFPSLFFVVFPFYKIFCLLVKFFLVKYLLDNKNGITFLLSIFFVPCLVASRFPSIILQELMLGLILLGDFRKTYCQVLVMIHILHI